MRRVLKAIGPVLVWAALSAVALVLSALVSIQLPVTRRVAAAWLSDFVSREIRGGLAISSLPHVSPTLIVARGVVLFDADGRRVIEADRLVLVPDLWAALHLRVRIARARLDGAVVHLIDDREGLPTMISSFDSPTPSSSTPSKSKPLEVQVDGIEVSHVVLLGDLLGLRDLRAMNVHARGTLHIGPIVRVHIAEARGELVEPFGYVAHVDALSGTISTAVREGVSLYARVHRDGERAEANIRYAADPAHASARQQLGLLIHAQQLSVGTIHGLGFDWMPEVAVPLSGHARLAGPTDDLAVTSEVETSAGTVQVAGRIAKTSGVSVTLKTDGLELAQVFPDYPRVHARGSLRIESAPQELTPRLHLELEPLLYGTIAVPGLKADGVLVDTGLRIDRIEALSRGARMTGHGRIEKRGAFELVVSATFTDIAADANLKRFLPDTHAGLEADLHIKSAQIGQAELSFDGHILLTDLRYGPITAKRLELRGSARGDPQRPRIELKVLGQEVRANAYLLGDPSLTVKGGPRAYVAEGQFVSAGRRTFDISARIAADDEGLSIDADPIELTVGEGSWRGALEGLRISDASVELGLLRLASRSQRLEAHGVLRFHGDDAFDLELQDFDLAALRALVGDQLVLDGGHADAHVQLAGDISDPDLRIQGALRGGTAGKLSTIDALYLVTYKAGQIEANGEVDLGSRGMLEVDGSGRIDRSLTDRAQALRFGAYDLELRSEGISIALIPAADRAGIDGTASGSVAFHGTLQNPSFSGTIAIDALQLPGEKPLYLLSEGGYDNGQLSVRTSLADEQGPLATASGQMQLDWQALSAEPGLLARTLMHGPWQLSGQTSERRLDQMPGSIGRTLPYPLALATEFELKKTDGVTSGAIHFDGVWKETLLGSRCASDVHPRLRGDLKLERGVSHISFSVLSAETQVALLEGELDTPVDRWAQDGRIERPQMLRANAKIAIDAMQNFPYVCEYGSGSINAELELDGGFSPQPLLAVKLDTTFLPRTTNEDRRKQTAAHGCEGDPIKAHLDFTADRETLSGSAHMQGCHGGSTEVDARLPVKWDRLIVLPWRCEERDLEVRVRFDGAQLRPLLDRIPGVMNTDAIAYGQINVSGPSKQPRIAGQIDLNNARLYLIGMGQELREISTRVSFLDGWAKIEHFQAQLGSGRLEAAGGIGFAGLWPDRARVALLATKLPIQREGVDTAWLTGSAVVDAEITAQHTHAVVKLQKLDVILPDTENRVLQPLEPNAEVVVVTQAPALPEQPYPIEVMIEGKRGLTVKRNDFNASITTELAVSYRESELNVGGYIAFSSGEFEIFGKRFAINNGALRFNGEEELDADIFLLATQKPDAAGVSPVTVTVTGTLSEPTVTFSSDVCPGESGAITYLVSGQCAADDPDLAQESAETQAAFTSGILGGVLTLGAQHELTTLVPRVSVERTGLGGQSVKAGFSSESIVPKFMRKLVRRVYVEGGVFTPGEQTASGAETAPSTSSTPQFLIELYFPHSIVGSGRFAPESWGVDMLWEP